MTKYLRMSNMLRFHVRLPYDGSPATANEEEQTRQCLQPDAVYVYTKCLLGLLHRLLSRDVPLILIPLFTVFTVKDKTSQARPADNVESSLCELLCR